MLSQDTEALVMVVMAMAEVMVDKEAMNMLNQDTFVEAMVMMLLKKLCCGGY